MTQRTLSVLATVLLLGCSSNDGATATEFDEDTGSGFPSETGADDTGAADTGSTMMDSTPGDAPVMDTTPPPTDTPADSPTGTAVKCGSFTCTSGQNCCIVGGIGACIATGAMCAGATYSCTSKSNCAAGQVCCISGAGTGGAACAAAADCPSTTTCDTNADCSGSAKNCVDIGGGIKACRK
jgi:hypothetical protein